MAGRWSPCIAATVRSWPRRLPRWCVTRPGCRWTEADDGARSASKGCCLTFAHLCCLMRSIMNEQEKNIDRFRNRLAAVLVLRHATMLATAWVFLWGTVVLLLRATAGTSNELLLWGLAVLPLTLAGGFALARRQIPSRSAVRALLDGQNHCGGVLMAAEETEVGRW